MKQIMTLALLTGILLSCRKTGTPPTPVPAPALEMRYTHFADKEIKFNEGFTADLNKDGIQDFYVYTLLVGDPLLQQDYRKYLFGSNLYTYFPINSNEEVPMLSQGNRIGADNFPGCHWSGAASIVMAQKVIGWQETHWEGVWRTATHRYLPLCIGVQDKKYYGWVEASFSPHDEKVILHQAAICKVPDTAVQAGY
jgi:hypothetical protein